ncbi:uncharacterized protein LOC143268244 [Peromyscus maniculatus bairdii]|uniref:uncharacterized protein LOC143268244 n=1 Tax=Peromyscus maniculatus bairdii TaxID=230844 RepID=UPI003FD53837
MKYGTRENLGFRTFIAQRAERKSRSDAAAARPLAPSRHRREGGREREQHLHLLCPQLSPSSSSSSSSSTPHGHPGGGPGGQPGTAGANEGASGREASEQASRRAGGLPRGGCTPLRLRLPCRGRPPGCSPARPPARSHPAPAAPRHERRRWLQGRVAAARPPLAPVRRHYSLFAASGGGVVGLGRRLHLYRGPSCQGEGPERGCPAPPRPPSVPPALSGSCLLLLLLLPVVQAPPSLLSFAARISLEFYSLPHVTHRVKLHLRRVTHQHSASPSRPGHRQQQPPPTEEPQPGSQPAPPSAECAAATHGNSRARARSRSTGPAPARRRRNLPKAFGLFREPRRRDGWWQARWCRRAETGSGGAGSKPQCGVRRLQTPAEEIWRKRGMKATEHVVREIQLRCGYSQSPGGRCPPSEAGEVICSGRCCC